MHNLIKNKSLIVAIIKVWGFFVKFYGLSSASDLTWEKMLLSSDSERSNVEGTNTSTVEGVK